MLFISGSLTLVRPRSVFVLLSVLFVLIVLVLPLSFISVSPLLSAPFKGVLALGSLLETILRMFQIHILEQLLLEALWKWFHMHIVAVSSSLAASVDILLALGVQEVSYWWKYGTDFLPVEKSAIDIVKCVLRVFLVAVLHVNVADNMVSQVIDNDHILDLSILTHFLENFLEELLKSMIKDGFTYWEPFQHPPHWRCYLRWWQFRRRCFRTCARVGQSRWLEACCVYASSCLRNGTPRSYRKRGSWLYPFPFHTPWRASMPFKQA